MFKLFARNEKTGEEGPVEMSADAPATPPRAETTPAPAPAAAPEPAAVGLQGIDLSEHPAMKASAEKIARLEAALAASSNATLKAEADRFASGLAAPSVGKIAAAQLGTLSGLYLQAARDDASSPASVAFEAADGPKTGSRVDALKAFFALAPTEAERFRSMVGGVEVFPMESVARGENPHDDRPPNPKNVARLKAMAGIDDDD